MVDLSVEPEVQAMFDAAIRVVIGDGRMGPVLD
jgi:hypothetical protein